MSETPSREKQIEDAKAYLGGRQRAYLSVFDPKSMNAQAVLEDLARFCRANKTTFHPDPRVHAAMEGRREVFLRIANHLNLNLSELYDLTRGAKNG